MIERIEFPKVEIPVLDLTAADAEMRFGMERWRAFNNLSLRPDIHAKLGAGLDNDPRIVALGGKKMNNGRGGGPFSLPHLKLWFLWRINEAGFEKACENLEAFLDVTELPVTHGLWIVGLSIDAPTDLGGGIVLTPGDQMPESYEKAKVRTRVMS